MDIGIMNFISNVNVSYGVLCILFLIVSLLFLSKRNVNGIIVEMIIILLVALEWAGFIYFNDILNSIFDLSFLSVKVYLVLLIIGNIIMLVTINRKMSLPYKIANYMFFLTNLLILGINITIILGNRYGGFIIGTLEDASKLININFIIFIEYLNLLFVIYILKYVISFISNKIKVRRNKKSCDEKESAKVDIETGILDNNIGIVYPFSQHDQEGFYIDGVDCSIIFDDEDQDVVMKNYYILLNDVNARLTNGCTVGEYKEVKNIINRLNIKDLNNLDLDVNKLNKMTIDEYNLLKRFLDNRNNSY